MIHTNRTVTVGNQESIIDSPIVLYRGDREVEVEFTLNGNKFTFTNGGNVIKSTNATHGQLVINTPTEKNMFSEITACREGKVIFLITKEMIDELVEIGFYSFQIRLFDESQVSRVTIPPVFQGIDIRKPIAAEDDVNAVDIGLVDYAIAQKDEYENLTTFLPDGSYNKTDWVSGGLITEAKLDKIEDALYTINKNMEANDLSIFNRIENVNQDVNRQITEFINEADAEIVQFKIDTNAAMTAHKNEVSEELESVNSQLAHKANEIFSNQEDFIETIKRNYKPKKMDFFVNNSTNNTFSIKNHIDNKHAIQYSTRQPALNSQLDGYILIGEGRYGELQKQPAITNRLPADNFEGEWDKTYPPSYYAKKVGATMTKTFIGERIDFMHFGDNRGGVWEFVLDGDEENAITLSTWHETSGAKGPFVLFDNLENKQHTLVATFKGDDPNHPPSSGVGTSRGWSYYNEGENNINSFYIYVYHDTISPIVTPLYGSSNKEFAISSRKKGSNYPFHFCPYHDVITSFQVEPPKIKIDGVEKELTTGDYFKNVNEIKIIQHINAKNPESSEVLAEIFTTTTFSNDGSITVDGKYTAKTDLDIDSAYGIMWMIDAKFNTKICSSINKTYLTSEAQMGTNLYLTDESDKTTSFISVSKDFPDICTAVTFNNPKHTLRSGMDKKVDKSTWIEYRSGGILTKLYQQVYGKTSINAGEVFRFSGTFIVGKVENIYNLV